MPVQRDNVHSSVYLHSQTRADLEKLQEKTGIASSSMLIRAAVAVLVAMPKYQVVEWLDEVRAWRNGKK